MDCVAEQHEMDDAVEERWRVPYKPENGSGAVERRKWILGNILGQQAH